MSSFAESVVSATSAPPSPVRIGLWSVLISDVRLQYRRSPKLLIAVIVAVVVSAILGAVGRVSASEALAVQVVFLGAIILGLMPMSGIVSDDLGSGFVRVLMQRGRSLRRYYVTVAVARLLGIAAATVLMAILLTLVPLANGAPFDDVRYALFLPLAALLTACIVFAMSAFGLARDIIGAMVYVFASSTVAYKLASVEGVPAELLRLMCFPLDALLEISGAGAHRPGSPPALLVVLLQMVAWMTIGALAVDKSARRST